MIKYIIIAIVCFVLGMLLGGGLSMKVFTDLGAKAMVDNMEKLSLEQVEALKGVSTNLYEQKKQEIITKFNEEKEELIEKTKQGIKEAINEKIDEIFSF